MERKGYKANLIGLKRCLLNGHRFVGTDKEQKINTSLMSESLLIIPSN